MSVPELQGVRELTITLPEDVHELLQRLAAEHSLGPNQLAAELVKHEIKQFDAKQHFRARAARGDPAEALRLLDRLDKHFAEQPS